MAIGGTDRRKPIRPPLVTFSGGLGAYPQRNTSDVARRAMSEVLLRHP